MRLYDFSLYAKQRAAARAVVETSVDLHKPGIVIELKQNVDAWLKLHREVVRKRA